MADSSIVRRKLFMHPAHRTVGVVGAGIATGPYCRIANFSTNVAPVAPTHVALAARKLDADACAALALFQQAIHQRRDIQCRQVDLDAVDVGLESLTDADCVVAFGQWIQVARHWLDIDAAGLGGTDIPVCPVGQSFSGRQKCLPHLGEDGPMEVELAAGARGHPVLEGVEPFVSCRDEKRGQSPFVRSRAPTEGWSWAVPAGTDRRLVGDCPLFSSPEDATVLLTGRTAREVRPVAWARRRCHGMVFCTTLGSAEDFRQPGFVRLMLNALAWIGR